jgi:hypothetical protein
VLIRGDELLVNGQSYGRLNPTDAVLVDHGVVSIRRRRPRADKKAPVARSDDARTAIGRVNGKAKVYSQGSPPIHLTVVGKKNIIWSSGLIYVLRRGTSRCLGSPSSWILIVVPGFQTRQ